jgi:hypothetical protein
MTAPDHLRITGPEDILGFIPHSLGYWPENSLVAMTLQGKRLGATLRVDLPLPGGGGAARAAGGAVGGGASGGGGGSGGSGAGGRGRAVPKRGSGSGRKDPLADFARNVVAYLQADEVADGSLLAFFTDTDADSRRGGQAWAALLKELELALEAAGLPLRDAWMIGAEFWRNAYCDDPACCGTPGRPIEEIRNSRLNAEMVYRGSSVGAVPGAQGTNPAPLSVDPAVRAAERGWAEQFSPRRRDRAQFDQVLDVWTMAMQAASDLEHPPGLAPGAPAPSASAPDAGRPDAGNHAAGIHHAGTPDAGNHAAGIHHAGTPEAGKHPAGNLSLSKTDLNSSDPRTAALPLQLSSELAGYLRASLCIPSWRDAVLVMGAAGRCAAEFGAEDFGMFDTEAGPGALTGSMSGSGLGPTPRPLPGPISGRTGHTADGSSDRLSDHLPNPASGNTSVRGTAPPETAVGGSAAGAAPVVEAVPGYGEVLLGLAPSVPDWAMMGGLDRVLERLGALGDGESTAAAVTARGWIEWCRGRGSYADALYQQALQEHPGYRLAELLAELGRRGTLCGWAARREAAWQKFAPDAA